MTQMESYSIRVDKSVRAAASAVAHELGTDLPNLTRMFYRQIAQRRSVPLSLSVQPSVPQETLDAVQEAHTMSQRKDPGFASVDGMFADLDI
ncbi:hypothetical protein KIM372_12310 [Bombiscardovia nodaiensis]|uniref:Damage-inducible protein J n=1 Tax=Bombiscardovia nodaiensis TaxID=2932181 RepID=A0ABM8B925_9BIFI|nr:hypothetical protein KIM372_12310 [Bombiscardovia nodaiensis]